MNCIRLWKPTSNEQIRQSRCIKGYVLIIMEKFLENILQISFLYEHFPTMAPGIPKRNSRDFALQTLQPDCRGELGTVCLA